MLLSFWGFVVGFCWFFFTKFHLGTNSSISEKCLKVETNWIRKECWCFQIFISNTKQNWCFSYLDVYCYFMYWFHYINREPEFRNMTWCSVVCTYLLDLPIHQISSETVVICLVSELPLVWIGHGMWKVWSNLIPING